MSKRLKSTLAISLTLALTGCGAASDDAGAGGATSSGGSKSSGGSIGVGGAGAPSNGGTPSVAGAQSAGAPSGGSAEGGAPSSAGAGGAMGGSGGTVAGGGSNGGAPASGGAAGAGGSAGGGATCALPIAFKWTSGGPVAAPKNGAVSLKDFTHVVHNGKHVVYMTTYQTNWGSAMMTFDDWAAAASATQTKTSFGIAPTLFYFSPKKLWVIAYQWGPHKFSYRTASDPTNPDGWSGEQSLYNTALPPNGTGPIDQTVICNAAKCFLYYAGDNGHIYKSSLPIGSFPGQFPAAVESGIQGTAQNLFEAVQVYTVKGSNKYLMIVEAQGNGRYFRAWTASDLDGPWALLTDNFAIKSNVTFSTPWTNDISHGDLVRTNPDETFTVDPCNLQLVFQGRDPNVNVEYGLLPYRMGLLTLVK